MCIRERDWAVVPDDASKASLTIAGWDEAERMSPARADKGFVAMWFSPELTPVFDYAIGPAISDAGYTPVRFDREEHVGRIDDLILAEIQESRFLVADFTGHRGGVYFEAGYALGLGLPVIWTCRED